MRRVPLFLVLLSLACGEDEKAEPGPTDGECIDALAASRSFNAHLSTGERVRAVVASDLRCGDTAKLAIEAQGRTYTIALSANQAEVVLDNATLITAEWNGNGGVTVTAGSASVGEPLRPYLLVTAAQIADFDAVGLALLDWGSLSQALDLEGADPNGNDPAPDAEALPAALRFLQDHPLVLRLEMGGMTAAHAEALVQAMMGMMNDEEVVDFHHFDLCHLGELFFTGHDAFVDRMEASVFADTPSLELPFGRLPFHEPGEPIQDAFATWAPIADEFYAEHETCGAYPRRACSDELRYTIRFSAPDVLDQYGCDPAQRATWCEGLLQGFDCSEEIGVAPEDYLGCEDGDGDGLPDECPYAMLKRFQGTALCDYATVDDLWAEMIAWHGQVHRKIGGAHADDAMTAATPLFWLFHVTISTVYEGYLRCP